TLTLTVENLNKIRQEKTELLNKQQEEKLKLAKTINEKNITISKLKKKENELRQIIKKKEKAAKDLQNAINKLIQEEITMSAKKAGTKPVKDKLTLVPEEVALSNDFSSNKGKLPWPIEKGFISTTFGSHPHPVISGIIIKNDGLNFTTTKGSTIRSIFKGKVSAVTSIPNYNNVVMIRHGEYLSVYANLATVYVKTGDYVKTKQAIGMIYYDEKEDNATIHFELRKGTTILNPAEWLIK
ncbi:MAG TPA: peptidoglycan DD-metalloendopeptidase family protein, partial [Bacteroidales bacterium]|nr:peptidoglycan DD-metalloendopeptidase family protein [Bacteroidales bacterium]